MNDKLTITNLRCLALDMIDEAKSGHPGMSLGSAAIVHTIYTRHMIANPAHPEWIKRDRFVMSSGHASALLYSVLHMAGYNIPMTEIKRYKQLNSITPGHPEYGVTPGVDISTGPLGQGLSNAVGFAIAERHLCASRPNLAHLLDHYTYVLAGDGDFEEGIGLEAMAIAGFYKLHKLIVCYDCNGTTLDGPLSQACSDDLKQKFLSMQWNVLEVEDGNNDVEAIDKAIQKAKKQNEKPTIIMIKTTIGYGSALAGSHEVHGKPLGKDGSAFAKKFYGWDHEDFFVEEEAVNTYKETFGARGKEAYAKYEAELETLSEEDKKEFEQLIKCDVVNEVKAFVPKKYPVGYNNATRNVSGEILNYYAAHTKKLLGGVADVAGSVKTGLKNSFNFTHERYDGKNINYGIREHAMMAITNGICAHGGLRTYAGSFLVFTDYARGAMRCAALMELPVVYILSHDSIAVGEDGPTHQPVEQTAAMRMIPNFNVVRPGDANEMIGAYEVAFSSKKTPTAIMLTRQNLKTVPGFKAAGVKKGAYILSPEKERLDATIIASGSEVSMAYEAKQILAKKKIDVRIVSMPSTFLFDKQSEAYKKKIIPNRRNSIFVELGVGAGLYKYADNVMSNDEFGKSAKFNELLEYYHFNAEELANRVIKIVKENKKI